MQISELKVCLQKKNLLKLSVVHYVLSDIFIHEICLTLYFANDIKIMFFYSS